MGLVGGRGQVGCVERIEISVKMQKKVGVAGSDQGLGVGRREGIARFEVVADVGYGGCKPIIEGIDKCT